MGRPCVTHVAHNNSILEPQAPGCAVLGTSHMYMFSSRLQTCLLSHKELLLLAKHLQHHSAMPYVSGCVTAHDSMHYRKWKEACNQTDRRRDELHNMPRAIIKIKTHTHSYCALNAAVNCRGQSLLG